MKSHDNKDLRRAHQSLYFPELIDWAYSHLPAALFATILLSLTLVTILWSKIPHQKLIVWISVLYVITIVRFFQYLKYHPRKNSPVENSAYKFNIGVILSGIVWGSSGILLFPIFSLPHQVFLAFVLGGVVAGATTSLAARQWVFKVFVCLMLIPVVWRFLLIGEEVTFAMGGMLAFYGVICIGMSSQIYIMLIKAIHLKHKNKEEIQERKKAEELLKKAHEKLEEKVQERTNELKKALDEVKTLRGILPICSHCKNIRNDQGYYERIEGYIHKHSGVDFTHTICPVCMEKHYPEEHKSIMKNKSAG